MRIKIVILLFGVAAVMSCTLNNQTAMEMDSPMKIVSAQLEQALDFLGDTTRNPAYATEENSLVLTV